MIQSTAVFPGSLTGIAWKWTEVVRELPASISRLVVMAKSFENALAIWALDHRVAAVATEVGSFACHAANLFRAARADGRFIPVWISRCHGLDRISSGTPVSITRDGSLRILTDWNPSRAENADSTATFESLIPEAPRELVAFNTTTSAWSRCYWPHRQYDPLTASLMMAGLRWDVAFERNDHPMPIEHGTDGLLWFPIEAPALEDLIARAVDNEKGESLVLEQVHTYDALLDSLRTIDVRRRVPLSTLVASVRTYFAHFLAFHNTYEHVFVELDRRLAHTLAHKDRFAVLDAVLSPEVIRWQRTTHIVLQNRKDILQDGPVVEAPPFGILSDVAVSSDRCLSMIALSKNQPNEGLHRYLRYAVLVAVTKEWKFFLNKMLTSRLAAGFRATMRRRGMTERELRMTSIEELLATEQ